MTLAISGARSAIAAAAELHAPPLEPVIIRALEDLTLEHDRYLLCTGYLAGFALSEISDADATRTWELNYLRVAQFCDDVLAVNSRARICVIGSESAFRGSHDMAYAGAKAALHRYVETKAPLRSDQMLVAIAPHIIWDSGMTQRRGDLATLAARGSRSRLGRWLSATEVALEALHLLYDASPALSGQVIRMRAE